MPENAYNTTPIQGPNLTVSDVTLTLVEGDGYVFNRSSSLNSVRRLSINVYDSENNTYVNNANVSFWLTNETNDFRLELINQTDSDGNSSFYFNPNCSHIVGHQYWIAGTTDSCYEEKNATQTNYTYNITGDLHLTITSPNGEKYLRGNYPDGQLVLLIGNLEDECGNLIPSNPVNFSMTQDSMTNHCNPMMDEGNGTYNCSLNTTGFSAKGWGVKMNSSRVNYNYNETEEIFELNQKGFWVETKPTLVTDYNAHSYSQYTGQEGDGGWGERWVFTVNATDEDDDTLSVKLWVDSNIYGGEWSQPNITAMSNNSVQGQNVSLTFTVYGWPSGANPGLGSHVFKFNVSETSVDFSQNTNQTSNGTFTIEKDDLELIHIIGFLCFFY